ncbi:chemotaxis protein CheW [Pendulispora albinea]|uniref:Chemotaxis protein CheW n=1 Tax=Pendulispora albinea TaxID=2741071 RepID=A0ABZ2LVH7_9BACT
MASSALTPYLTFALGNDSYATALLRIKEIAAHTPISRVPETPAWLLGVTNLRGTVVPVISLARRLGLPSAPVTKKTCILVLDIERHGEPSPVALEVDSVSELLELGPDSLEPCPAFGTPIESQYILGIAHTGERLVYLLDLDRVLNVSSMASAAQGEPRAT